MASIASSLSYTELMDLVYSIPPLRPTHLAQGILGTVIALIVIDTIAVGLRIYVRTILNRSAFGLDDVLAAAGYVCYLVATVYAAVGCFYGFGTRDADLPSQLYQIRGAQLFMWWIISYIFSIPFIKSAIAAQIMRLTKLRSYRIPLWFVCPPFMFFFFFFFSSSYLFCINNYKKKSNLSPSFSRSSVALPLTHWPA